MAKDVSSKYTVQKLLSEIEQELNELEIQQP